MSVQQNANEFHMPTPEDNWTTGPLPTPELEHVAWLLFRERYPLIGYDNSLVEDERNKCRRLALTLRAKFQQIDRWTLFDAAERLTDQACRLSFGDRRLGPTLRNQVKDYCESFMEDLLVLFPAKLFYPRDVEANQIEVERDIKGVVDADPRD